MKYGSDGYKGDVIYKMDKNLFDLIAQWLEHLLGKVTG
jgi:hypothetical protein